MKKKRILLSIICTMMILMTTVPVFAGSYESTYTMTGGVFSRSITATQYIKTIVMPSVGTPGSSIGVILATKQWYGWDGPVQMVDSAYGGTVTHNCNGTYKIWLRNFTTTEVKGRVNFYWQ